MQTNGCLSQENGEEAGAPSTSHLNGTPPSGSTTNGVLHGEGGDSTSPPLTTTMTETDKDIVRLIGQHLQSLGLQYVCPFLNVQVL